MQQVKFKRPLHLIVEKRIYIFLDIGNEFIPGMMAMGIEALCQIDQVSVELDL